MSGQVQGKPDGRGGSIQTCPQHHFGDFPRFKWDAIADHLPAELAGTRCLDIGTNAGFYAFELARRGGEVLAIDENRHYLEQAEFARERLGLRDRVELRRMQAYDLPGLQAGGDRFGLILFLGVFYHLRYPLLVLDAVAKLLAPGGLLVFQTLTMPGEAARDPEATRGLDFSHRGELAADDFPKMAFFEHGFCEDPTNFWAANHAGCEAMLRSAGLSIEARPAHEFYLCRADAAKRADPMRRFIDSQYAAATSR